MPVTVNDEERERAMQAGSSELKFLLAREGVEETLQAKFFHVGICTISKFATIVDTVAELKDMLKTDFELDATANLGDRVKVASVVVAYKAALSRTEKAAEVEGELQSKRLQKPLASSDFSVMRSAFEHKWWPLEDSQCPARSYLEARAEQFESGDCHAEQLTTVLSRDEDRADTFQSFWDATGQLQLRKGGTTVPEPTNPEALRRRIKLLFTGLIFLGMRHTNRPELQNITPQDAEDYLSYLLGEHVWQLSGKNADGSTIATPGWGQLLIYEHSIRKKALHLVASTGMDFRTAIRQAYNDPTTKERFFTTPVALSATGKRPLSFKDEDGWRRSTKVSKFGGKAKGKQSGKNGQKGGVGGKGKSRGKGKGKSDYCYAFNNSWERCRRQNCPFKHLCSRCGGQHPVYQCTNSEAPAETQGAGHE